MVEQLLFLTKLNIQTPGHGINQTSACLHASLFRPPRFGITSRGVNAQKKSLCLKMTLGQEPHGQMDHFGDESLGTDVCERLFGEVYIYD